MPREQLSMLRQFGNRGSTALSNSGRTCLLLLRRFGIQARFRIRERQRRNGLCSRRQQVMDGKSRASVTRHVLERVSYFERMIEAFCVDEEVRE